MPLNLIREFDSVNSIQFKEALFCIMFWLRVLFANGIHCKDAAAPVQGFAGEAGLLRAPSLMLQIQPLSGRKALFVFQKKIRHY